jgi:hypothetical protein
MLDYKAAARLPETIQFTRNDRSVVACRVRLGSITVAGNALLIADPSFADATAPIPVRVPEGTYPVHAYQWDHSRGAINVCVVVQFRPQWWAIARRMTIHNHYRPDITHGIIVDTAEVCVGSPSEVTLPSGMGDGVYPVAGVYNLGLFMQAVVLDFRMWEIRDVVLLPGQEFDEYRIVRRVGKEDSA